MAHNISTDLQFLFCEYIRVKLTLDPKITFGLCSYRALKSLKTRYTTAENSEWTEVTATGNRCYSVKCCAQYALSCRTPPGNFLIDCGNHHEAKADVKAIAVILFDREVFGNEGLWGVVFHKRRKVCIPVSTIWSEMVAKMQEPVIAMKAPPPGWILGVPENPSALSPSSTTLPSAVREHLEPKFTLPRRARAPGSPSEDRGASPGRF